MKKIFALGLLIGLTPLSTLIGMDKKKENNFTYTLADFLRAPAKDHIPKILDDIKALEDENRNNLDDLQKHKELARLYKVLADKPQSKEQARKTFLEKSAINNKKALAIEQMNAIEQDIDKSLTDTALPMLPKIEQYSRAIQVYQHLIELAQGGSYHRNAHYLTQLRDYEKLKLREEIQDQIRQLQEANNPKGLKIAYQSLLKTYTNPEDPQVKSLQDQLSDVEKQIAQEKRDEYITSLKEILFKAGSCSYANEAARKINMANLSLELADAYNEDERYTKEYATEIRRAKNIALQAAAFTEYKEHKEHLNKRLQ